MFQRVHCSCITLRYGSALIIVILKPYDLRIKAIEDGNAFANTRNYSSRNKNVLVHVYVLFRLLNSVYFKTEEVNKLICFLLI
jgi:hypothetical protein